MKKKLQLFAFVLMPLLVVLLLSGCARQQQQGAAAASPAAGKIVLNFWNGFTGPDGRAMEAMVDRFREQNPDIEVTTKTSGAPP